MKVCFKCGIEKELSEFHKHPKMMDGLLGKCKDCATQDVRANRAKRVDHYREYDRKRGYHNAPGYLKDYRAKNPEKYKAQSAVGNAVRDGMLTRPDTCSECGGKGRIHAHHEDYSKHLDVVWLCPPCHKARHIQILNDAGSRAPERTEAESKQA